MYYKVEKGTETYLKLDNILKKTKECNNATINLVNSLGYKKFVLNSSFIAGGLSAIQAKKKPDGFKSSGYSNKSLYAPKKSNKALLNKISELPVVTYEEFNETIGFEQQFSDKYLHNTFGLSKRNDLFLIEVDDNCNYTPKPDMIEILSSEYKELNKN